MMASNYIIKYRTRFVKDEGSFEWVFDQVGTLAGLLHFVFFSLVNYLCRRFALGEFHCRKCYHLRLRYIYSSFKYFYNSYDFSHRESRVFIISITQFCFFHNCKMYNVPFVVKGF